MLRELLCSRPLRLAMFAGIAGCLGLALGMPFFPWLPFWKRSPSTPIRTSARTSVGTYRIIVFAPPARGSPPTTSTVLPIPPTVPVAAPVVAPASGFSPSGPETPAVPGRR